MKRYVIVVLILALFVLTGCTNLKDLSYDQIVDKTLEEKKLKNNTYLEGYKLYLPQNMTMIGDLNGNDILFSKGDQFYLYVDIIRENYISDDTIFSLIDKIEEINGVKLTNNTCPIDYVIKGNTDIVCEMMRLTFTRPMKRMNINGQD